MGSMRGYTTFEEFEREELRLNRNSAWSVNELVEDFSLQEELDLELLEGDREPPSDDDED
ncbi:MAG: hypothetical protein HY905_27925 [Deltaproteobacteria bacterium]|nr:hypothetical protein [Deltaproteobacteria bacterium]